MSSIDQCYNTMSVDHSCLDAWSLHAQCIEGIVMVHMVCRIDGSSAFALMITAAEMFSTITGSRTFTLMCQSLVLSALSERADPAKVHLYCSWGEVCMCWHDMNDCSVPANVSIIMYHHISSMERAEKARSWGHIHWICTFRELHLADCQGLSSRCSPVRLHGQHHEKSHV